MSSNNRPRNRGKGSKKKKLDPEPVTPSICPGFFFLFAFFPLNLALVTSVSDTLHERAGDDDDDAVSLVRKENGKGKIRMYIHTHIHTHISPGSPSY